MEPTLIKSKYQPVQKVVDDDLKIETNDASNDINTPTIVDSKEDEYNDLKTEKQDGACDLNTEKINASKADSDSSCQIIYHGLMFSPYKSDLEREWAEEDRIFEAKNKVYEDRKKRVRRLSEEWDWSAVIDLDDSDEDEEKNQLKDTANSGNKKKSPIKIPRVTIQKRNRPHLI